MGAGTLDTEEMLDNLCRIVASPAYLAIVDEIQ